MRALLAAGMTFLFISGCEPDQGDPSLLPDELLQAELGLTAQDRVHRVALTGGAREEARPSALSIERGSHVEFVTTDWLIHEVVFDEDSIGEAGWAFLQRTDQVASPPLIERDSRYLLTFEGAPAGRYPYRLEGNAAAGHGVIVVTEPEVR